MEKKTTEEIIDEIHTTFYTEVDRLLSEAKKLNQIESDKQHLIDKSKSLIDLGFTNTKEVRIAEEEIKKIDKLKQNNAEKQDLVKAINYFTIKYPNYKFITEESVKKICEKYGLVYGNVSRYEGVVPTKNLEEIKNFSIKEEDRCYDKKIEYIGTLRLKENETVYVGHSYITKKRKIRNPKNKKIEITPSPLEIAAPKKDFNLTDKRIVNYKLEDKKKEIPDPIVLQPVFFENKKYYLIVTAWGEEGYDELVFNEKNN